MFVSKRAKPWERRGGGRQPALVGMPLDYSRIVSSYVNSWKLKKLTERSVEVSRNVEDAIDYLSIGVYWLDEILRNDQQIFDLIRILKEQSLEVVDCGWNNGKYYATFQTDEDAIVYSLAKE